MGFTPWSVSELCKCKTRQYFAPVWGGPPSLGRGHPLMGGNGTPLRGKARGWPEVARGTSTQVAHPAPPLSPMPGGFPAGSPGPHCVQQTAPGLTPGVPQLGTIWCPLGAYRVYPVGVGGRRGRPQSCGHLSPRRFGHRLKKSKKCELKLQQIQKHQQCKT